MAPISLPDQGVEIHPIAQGDLFAVLDVYRQCEDFLALGPVPVASMEMVLKDIEISKEEGGLFCGIYSTDGKMIGIIAFVANNYRGEPATSYLELLMIAAPYRNQGLGRAIVEAVELEIRKESTVSTILAGVQVNNPRAIRFWQRNGYHIFSGPELMPDRTTTFGLRKDLESRSST